MKKHQNPRSDVAHTWSAEWAYVLLTIAAWVFIPEIRRVADWRGSFDPLNAFAVIPLIMLLPIVVMTFRRRRMLRKSALPLVTLVWASGFAYALLIGTARGALLSGLYAGAAFVLPSVIGFWLLTRPETMEFCHRRVARWLLIYGGIAGLYGIIQFVLAPPWDTAWMINLGGVALGTPEPFGIRVFGVLNNPGMYAIFLGTVILLNLPFLTAKAWGNLVAVLFIVIGLLLSLVRSGWLVVLFGIIIFVLLSPKRLAPIITLSYVAALCTAATIAFLVVLPNQSFSTSLMTRFQSFTRLGDDGSAIDREATSRATLEVALQNPIGAGLGLTGGSGKLQQSSAASLSGAPTTPIDNGFITRLFEMGAFGFCAFMAACLLAMAVTWRSYKMVARMRNSQLMQSIAACFAAEIAIFLVNLSGDDQQGLLGVLFFIAIALPMMPQAASVKTDVLRRRMVA